MPQTGSDLISYSDWSTTSILAYVAVNKKLPDEVSEDNATIPTLYATKYRCTAIAGDKQLLKLDVTLTIGTLTYLLLHKIYELI